MEKDNSKWKLMILDDDFEKNNLLKEYFSNLNFNVVNYTDSKEAIEFIRNNDIDLLLISFTIKPTGCFDILNVINTYTNKPHILLIVEREDLIPSLEIINNFSISTYWIQNQKLDQLYLLVLTALKNREQSQKIDSITKNLEISQKKLEQAYIDSMKTLRYTVELNDMYSKGHSERVSELSALIGKYLNLSEEDINKLRVGGLFHDIGKIGVSDEILLKNSKLTDEEFNEVKNHPVIGKNILSNSSFFDDIIPIVLYHHEKYDGTGYPEGLKKENIPFLARITAIADTFDAMASKRPYREAISIENIKNEIKKYSGTQFDPQIAKVFLYILENHYDEIDIIQNKY